MACDTFIKIAQKCRRHFVQVQVGEVMPFIDEILNNINTIICDLQPQQVHTFYEAVGYMIGAQTDQAVQERLIEKYMLLPNQVWDSIIQQATKVRTSGILIILRDLGIVWIFKKIKKLFLLIIIFFAFFFYIYIYNISNVNHFCFHISISYDKSLSACID